MKIIAAIVSAFFSLHAVAQDTITLSYSWTAGDKASNFYRALVDEANRIQKQYTFIFEPKPGAGGTVAANYVDRNPDNSLWLNSSAGFIRQNLFPDQSHDMADFRIILPMCVANFVIASHKYRSWQEVPRDKPLSIGTSGMGTTTHLVAIQIQKNYPNLNIVPFKSTSEALMGVLSGSVDLAVGFHGDSEQYVAPETPKQIHWLGQTGRTSVKNTGLLSDQGFGRDLVDMSPPHIIFASRKMKAEKFSSLREILVEASRAKIVRDANAADNCVPNNQMPGSQLDTWFDSQMQQWKRLTQAVKLDK